MNKKEFYEAPEWGMRVVMVERHILDGSFGNSNDEIPDEVEGGDL